MKKIILAAAVAAFCACASKGDRVDIQVENTLDFDRSAEMVELPVAALGLPELTEGQAFVVTGTSGANKGVVVPSQVTHDGKLIFQSTVGAGGKAEFAITIGAPTEFATKTTGRGAPERYDDFIWENDRVAFRIYGAALEPVDGPSNGIDALYKRVEEPILDKWYADFVSDGLSYHDDNGTGLDDYKVGPTLGAGGAAPWVDGKLVLNGNYQYVNILDNGPLRFTFRASYPDFQLPATGDTEGLKVNETRTFSIDAGSQLTRVTEFYAVAAPMQVAVGYPLHAEDVKSAVSGRVLMVTEPATEKSSGVYLGLVMPSAIGETVTADGHVLAVTDYKPGQPLTWYTGFGWEKFGDWDGAKWGSWLDNFALALETPLVVKRAR